MLARSENVYVEELLDLDVLQRLQDGFAASTGMSVILCRRDGKILTRPSFGHELCRRIYERDREGLGQRLDRAIEAARSVTIANRQGPTAWRAETDQYAAPIVVDGRRLATIVVAEDPCSRFAGKTTEELAEAADLTREQVTELLTRTVKLGDEQRRAAIDLLHSLATTLAQWSHREYELKSRISELTMLHSVASMFAGRADLDEILRITAEHVVEATGAKACSIRIRKRETNELQIRAVANLSDKYLRKGPLRLDDSPIDRSALGGETVYIDMATDPRVIYKDEAKREGLVNGLAVGMIHRGEGVGVIHVYTGKPYRFEDFEVESIKAIASQAASAIVNAQLHLEAHEAEQMQRQLMLAGQVQRRMLPKEARQWPNLDIGKVYQPSYQVGGDFYDILAPDDGRVGFLIADVAGKGVPASLQMASLRASLRAFGSAGRVVESIARIDKAFKRDTLPGEFATVFLGMIDLASGRLEYVDAGHNPPLLLHGGQVSALEVTGPLLGVFDKPDFESRSLTMGDGDTLVLYTDGVIDAMDFNEKRFGEDRFRASVVKYGDSPAQQMAKNILWDVRRFVGLATQSDDITLVVVKYRADRRGNSTGETSQASAKSQRVVKQTG